MEEVTEKRWWSWLSFLSFEEKRKRKEAFSPGFVQGRRGGSNPLWVLMSWHGRLMNLSFSVSMTHGEFMSKEKVGFDEL